MVVRRSPSRPVKLTCLGRRGANYSLLAGGVALTRRSSRRPSRAEPGCAVLRRLSAGRCIVPPSGRRLCSLAPAGPICAGSGLPSLRPPTLPRGRAPACARVALRRAHYADGARPAHRARRSLRAGGSHLIVWILPGPGPGVEVPTHLAVCHYRPLRGGIRSDMGGQAADPLLQHRGGQLLGSASPNRHTPRANPVHTRRNTWRKKAGRRDSGLARDGLGRPKVPREMSD